MESVRFSSTAVFATNPLTFAAPVDLRYEHRLYGSTSPILRRNFFGAAAGLVLGPFVAPSVRADIQPLSLVSLGATYGVNVLPLPTTQSFPSPTSDYGVSYFGIPQPTPGYGTTIRSLRLDATLQGGVGKIGFRSTNAATYGVATLRAGDTVYYNPAADLLLPRRGWLYSSDTTINYEVTKGVRLGVRTTVFATSYPASAYRPGEDHDAVDHGPVVRIGPSFTANVRDSEGAFGRIDVFGSAQWYARDRYRTGEVISGYLPCITLGIRTGAVLSAR